MRIITGRSKGIRLDTLEGNDTRPTSERTKEAVFSMLQFDIEGRAVLDLFAGSGQLGLEAASRGACRVDLVERARGACAVISKNISKSRLADVCTLYEREALAFLKMNDGRVRYDIVFLDPPYASTLISDSLELLCSCSLLKPTSLVICESDRLDIMNEKIKGRFDTVKSFKHGIAYVTVLRLKGAEEE